MRSQAIAIPRLIESRYDALSDLPRSLKAHGFKRILFLVGAGIEELFEQKMQPLLSDETLEVVGPIVLEELAVEKLTPIAYGFDEMDVILAMGGGKAIDSGKFVSFLRAVPFISIPTSISNDGFASSGASLYVNGKRKSVKALMPYGVIADLSILSTAPERFYYSGLGDVVSKITANYDWQFEVNHGIGQVDQYALLTAKKSVNSVVRLPFSYIREGLFIKEVVDSLIMSGISMEVAGHSAPASGSEHLISHAMDSIVPGKYLHGVQVGIATYIMALVQEHRVERVRTFLTDTGFFAHAKSLSISKKIVKRAIQAAPNVKPNRYTTIHLAENPKKAIELLTTDAILNDILAE
ncbi:MULTISPECIES: iron-containing alcohol dehydrogenase family protein [unclassified Fusibacter]|uniref:iron-containing alcohol dehydrogenase family protein n=1 Tax=unclassified Fusibacter TaxID=2624464 RepID=UPI0010131F30|nr:MULTISPECIES: iron-containing alcohol dehydrogenase family protein [unclassified Fusibacter]MCK8060371.1 iron-containing alcohol dehydrogenase family protein [Fusibacter sp. A2]NPE20340.1 iron-containing alcohol dehydrogenase family protein [Fusibacter sp. A1]RXV63546.1 iron-containing alcohol dehydrogenase [Fusibacter sp. A1]